MSSTKLTTDNIESLDAAKLSGALPAIDGSNLTGIGDFMVSSSDPTTSENPSGGVGTLWMNHSSGEAYMLTNAAANSNVWTNIGASGTGDVFKPPFSMQGSYGGYVVGGQAASAGANFDINHFLFSSSAQQADHNSLTYGAGTNMDCTKDLSGGWCYARGNGTGYSVLSEDMQRFSFTSGVSTQTVGTLTGGAAQESFHFSNSGHGFYSGGGGTNATTIANVTRTDKFAFTTNVSRISWGALQHACMESSSCQDGEDYGYCVGNLGVWGSSGAEAWKGTKIQKVNLQSSATASYITDAQYYQLRGGGVSSTTHGYTHGGHWYNGPAGGNITRQVSRFQFSTGNQMVEIGVLDKSRHDPVGCSSTTHGYSAGGIGGTMPNYVDIDRYAYSSSVSSSDWGTLSGGNSYGGSTER